jgi:hypothetical protein
MEIVRDPSRAEVFWCPMHPDVRSSYATRCSLCGMDLVPIPPPKVGEYKVDVVVDRTRDGARGLRFTVREPGTFTAVRDFAVVHEKRFHLFIVSTDLEYFAHVHPEQAADGSFVLQHPLPRGDYMLIADFLPQGGTSQMVQRAVIVGDLAEAAVPPALRAAARPSSSVVNDGVRVALKVEDFAPGKHACLTFSLADAKTGEPVVDLQPYLGAPAHMLLVRADLSDVVHAHPEELATGGPSVSFHPLVPATGDYKLWVQFQRAGRVTTVPFVVSTSR